MIVRDSVDSSLIISTGYDAETQTLEIQFRRGKKQLTDPVYSYRPFTAERYLDFRQAERSVENPQGSLGRWFLRHIKNDKSLTVEKVAEHEEQKTEETKNQTTE